MFSVKDHRILKHFNKTLSMSFLVIAVSTLNYGFDNNGYTTTQAMTPFIRQFGKFDETSGSYELPTAWLSMFNSLNFIGYAFGVILGSLINERFGRRWCMFSMSGHAIVCAAIAVTSFTPEQIMTARVLNYIYIGMELAVIPVYQAEIIPTPIRGFAVGSYQFSLMVGGFIMNCICRGTSTMTTNAAWRIPLGLFFVVPTIVMSLIWFIPESPRWLLTRGRVDEARESLHKLRVGTMTDAAIDDEFAGLQFALEQETEQGRYKEIFQGVNKKRTAIIVAINFFQQASGQAFASSYGAIFVRSVGSVNPFNMTIINASVNLFMCGISLFLNDRVGRRPLLMTGAVWQTAAIMTMGGLGTIKNPSVMVKKATVAMLPLFTGGYCLGWAPLVYVVTTEVAALRLRDASQRTASIVNVVTAFAVNFSIPYLLYEPYAALGGRVGFIFGSIAICSFFFTWLFVPECKGKSLEQIDLMFNEGVSLRKFGSHQAVSITGETTIEEMKRSSGEVGSKRDGE